MHADPSNRMDEIKIIRVIVDQTIPDVLGRCVFIVAWQDNIAFGAADYRKIILSLREQVVKERLDFRGGGPWCSRCHG